MLDVLKQSIFASLGAAQLTREKVAEVAAEIAKQVNLSGQQAADFESQFTQRAEAARKEWEAEVDHRIDRTLIQLGIVKAAVKKEAEQASARGQVVLDDLVEKAILRLGLARAEDIEALIKRVEALEAKD